MDDPLILSYKGQALDSMAREAHTSKAALIRQAIRPRPPSLPQEGALPVAL